MDQSTKTWGYMWNPQVEVMPRPQLTAQQGQFLHQQVARAYERVPFYRQALDAQNILPKDIQTIDDISHLPFTIKEDFRTTYPYGLVAVPLKDVVRLHASSGTTGKPVIGAYTRADMGVWGEVMARTLTAGGVTAEDVFQYFYGYGLFTGGLGFHIGVETIGATVIPVSGGLTRRQLMLME